MLNQLKYLIGEGYEITGISAPGEHLKVVEEAGVHTIAVPMTRRVTPIADLISLVRLVQLMRREKFTIVHTHTPKPALVGQLAARLAGVPIIVNTLHGLVYRDDTPRLKRAVLLTLDRFCAQLSHFILSQNPDDIETFVNEGLAPRDKLRLIGNGIDISRFDPSRISPEAPAKLRKELGIGENDKVIGFVGRLVIEKGLVELTRALELVAEKVPNVKLCIVGPNEVEKSDALSHKDARFDSVRDRMIFTGLRDDMPELLSMMDVLALPSHREGFPRSPMEAAAMKKPVVVTDITGCRETVIHGKTGFLFPKHDAEALADRLLELLMNPTLVSEFGEAGRRLAEERFDERNVFRIVAKTYRELLTQKGHDLPERGVLRAPAV
ncbi:MAG: glycosyltransferase family 4 protein [Polyangiaceae bacterium]|nr:glycosyltransferase family 4 protein [Polyangiaceae bacterium]